MPFVNLTGLKAVWVANKSLVRLQSLHRTCPCPHGMFCAAPLACLPSQPTSTPFAGDSQSLQANGTLVTIGVSVNITQRTVNNASVVSLQMEARVRGRHG